MIRAFITTWSGIKGGNVSNPIVEYCNNPPRNPILFVCNMYYPDADKDGLPDKSRVLVIVEGDQGETRIEELKNLIGVKMIPAYPFNTPITELPQIIKDRIKTIIINEGIPLSALSDIKIYGDFLRKVSRYFNANFKDFGKYELRSGDWG